MQSIGGCWRKNPGNARSMQGNARATGSDAPIASCHPEEYRPANGRVLAKASNMDHPLHVAASPASSCRVIAISDDPDPGWRSTAAGTCTCADGKTWAYAAMSSSGRDMPEHSAATVDSAAPRATAWLRHGVPETRRRRRHPRSSGFPDLACRYQSSTSRVASRCRHSSGAPSSGPSYRAPSLRTGASASDRLAHGGVGQAGRISGWSTVSRGPAGGPDGADRFPVQQRHARIRMAEVMKARTSSRLASGPCFDQK